MIELLYPYEPAPIVGDINPDELKSASEILPVVADSGLVVGRTTREWCHTGEPRPLHPVVHLEIVDRYSRFYLQHRGEGKESFPGRWDVAVGGHVSYGEMYGEALVREAGEELGFYDFNPQYLDNYVSEEGGEKEMVSLYVAIGTYDLHPDNFEVSEGRYWSLEEIEANLGKDVFTPEFENEFSLYKDRILSML